MHVPHGDVHEVGLQDDCPGCLEIAGDPIGGADDAMLRGFVQLASRGSERFQDTRWSHTHMMAVARVLTIMEWTGKLAQASPDGLMQYLRDTWRVPV